MAEGEMAMAEIIRHQGPNEWQHIEWDLVKELRKTITQCRLASLFAQNLLQNVMEGHF